MIIHIKILWEGVLHKNLIGLPKKKLVHCGFAFDFCSSYGGKVKLDTIDIIPKMMGIITKLANERYCNDVATWEHTCAKVENGA